MKNKIILIKIIISYIFILIFSLIVFYFIKDFLNKNLLILFFILLGTSILMERHIINFYKKQSSDDKELLRHIKFKKEKKKNIEILKVEKKIFYIEATFKVILMAFSLYFAFEWWTPVNDLCGCNYWWPEIFTRSITDISIVIILIPVEVFLLKGIIKKTKEILFIYNKIESK